MFNATLTFKTEVPFSDFEFWGGAESTRDFITARNENVWFNIVPEILVDMCENQTCTETDINDFVWFDLLEVLEDNGYYDAENDTMTDNPA